MVFNPSKGEVLALWQNGHQHSIMPYCISPTIHDVPKCSTWHLLGLNSICQCFAELCVAQALWAEGHILVLHCSMQVYSDNAYCPPSSIFFVASSRNSTKLTRLDLPCIKLPHHWSKMFHHCHILNRPSFTSAGQVLHHLSWDAQTLPQNLSYPQVTPILCYNNASQN